MGSGEGAEREGDGGAEEQDARSSQRKSWGLTGREAWRWRVSASVEERRALRLYSICIRAASRLASMRCNAARQGAGDSLLHALGRHTAIHIHIPTTAIPPRPWSRIHIRWPARFLLTPPWPPPAPLPECVVLARLLLAILRAAATTPTTRHSLHAKADHHERTTNLLAASDRPVFRSAQTTAGTAPISRGRPT